MKRNPIARSLRSAHLQQKVIPNKKGYTRKGRNAQKASDPSAF